MLLLYRLDLSVMPIPRVFTIGPFYKIQKFKGVLKLRNLMVFHYWEVKLAPSFATDSLALNTNLKVPILKFSSKGTAFICYLGRKV